MRMRKIEPAALHETLRTARETLLKKLHRAQAQSRAIRRGELVLEPLPRGRWMGTTLLAERSKAAYRARCRALHKAWRNWNEAAFEMHNSNNELRQR